MLDAPRGRIKKDCPESGNDPDEHCQAKQPDLIAHTAADARTGTQAARSIGRLNSSPVAVLAPALPSPWVATIEIPNCVVTFPSAAVGRIPSSAPASTTQTNRRKGQRRRGCPGLPGTLLVRRHPSVGPKRKCTVPVTAAYAIDGGLQKTDIVFCKWGSICARLRRSSMRTDSRRARSSCPSCRVPARDECEGKGDEPNHKLPRSKSTQSSSSPSILWRGRSISVGGLEQFWRRILGLIILARFPKPRHLP